MLAGMESQTSSAEEFPALYRSILDGIADLERGGQRREAMLLRREARDAYSASWDERGRRRLTLIGRRIERLKAGRERPRRAWPRRGRAGAWLAALRAPSPGR